MCRGGGVLFPSVRKEHIADTGDGAVVTIPHEDMDMNILGDLTSQDNSNKYQALQKDEQSRFHFDSTVHLDVQKQSQAFL